MLYNMSMLAALIVSASAVPVPVAVPNVPPPVQGAAASRTINTATKPLSDKRKLQSTPTPPDAAYVQKASIPSEMSDQIQGYCQTKFCDGPGLEWHMLGDPMDDWLPDPTWVQAHPDKMTWSGLENPTVIESEVTMDCDNTLNSSDMVCKATLKVERGLTMTTSTEVESKVGVEFSVKASIPEVIKVGAETSFEVSTTDKTEKEVSQLETNELSDEVPVPAGQRKCAYVTQKTTIFESTWTLPMSITDQGGKGIRCQYSSTCNDHYYWFANLDGAIDTWYTMSGKSSAKTISYGQITTRDGACDSQTADKGQLI